jgi:FkbM family methyltransferase
VFVLNALADGAVLLRHARGVRSKTCFCRYVLTNAIWLATLGRRHSNSVSEDRETFLRFKHANVWFQALSGELTTYLEIFHRCYYDFDFYLRSGEAVVDVGANVGLFSISKASDPKVGTVYAFEPDPRAYSRLLKNLAANSAANVTATRKAVWNSVGTARLRLKKHTTSSTISGMGGRGVVVETISLDAFARDHQIVPIGILKIDVEGAELEVLQGAQEVLTATRQIVAECHSGALRARVDEFLTRRGFVRKGEHKLAGCSILGFTHAQAGAPVGHANN